MSICTTPGASRARALDPSRADVERVRGLIGFVCSRCRETPRQCPCQSILRKTTGHVTTDHVLIETWLLLNSRYHRRGAERFWESVRVGHVHVELTTGADLESAWAIGVAYSDQGFSIVDRTSFAVIERLGITRVASFDDDFAVYRYGRNRDRAFEVVR